MYFLRNHPTAAMYHSHLLTILIIVIHIVHTTGQQMDTVFIDRDREVKNFKITTYHPNGSIASETYVGREFRNLGREELFMRGLPGDYAEKGFYDTKNYGILYWPDGRIKAWREYRGLSESIYYQEYSEDNIPGWITADHQYGPLPSLMAFDKMIAFDRRYELITGKIGNTIQSAIRIESLTNHGLTLHFESNSALIRVPSTIRIGLHETLMLPIEIKIPEKITDAVIRILDEEGREILYKIKIRGYHIDPTNLSSSREMAPLIHLSGVTLVINGDHPNKIIHIYRGRKKIKSVPTSNLRTEIHLDELKTRRQYLLESVNLGTNETRYIYVQFKPQDS